ncbi:MAG: hypothetical protein RLZZ502_685, partial [Pseudomonadota bacterium]
SHLSNTVGVANVSRYLAQLPKAPKYLTSAACSAGFEELGKKIITDRR